VNDDPTRWWSGALHQSFRLLSPPSRSLPVFLASDGKSPAQVLAELPYEVARAGPSGSATGVPDAKRYRDPRLVYATAGLLYERDETVHVTELGRAVSRWLDVLTVKNAPVLGRHAAYALATCQLRNPLSRSGRTYPDDVMVFPFVFIWKAALALDDRISSEELNRVIFKIANEDELNEGIRQIAEWRKLPDESRDPGLLGPAVITEQRANDRIVPWVSLASFGYLLMEDKQGSDYYRIRPELRRVVAEAAQLRRRHREFDDAGQYVEHISAAASLPKDVR
jgi:hypothetical protein